MIDDEELLKPSRELIAMLRGKIEALRTETAGKIERYGRRDDDDYVREAWGQFHMAVEPLYREIEAVVQTMVNYYAMRPLPPHFIDVGESRTYGAKAP